MASIAGEQGQSSAGAGTFADRLLPWFDQHGRHDLPWQHPRSAYRAWLAEVMLQQTQVRTVVPYFERFLAKFADLPALAHADLDAVLALWSGLGYYTRARNLHRAAQICMERHAGALPTRIEDLSALPGIGRSTAGAILAQAHGQRHAILDGNVRRVLARHATIAGDPGTPLVQRQLWALSERLLPDVRLADYTQAIMDLGATVCTRARPRCGLCPVADDCQARAHDAVTAYPQPRTRRERPVRSTLMLLLHDADGRILLERRPPVGIWAGLWSLPEAPSLTAAAQRWIESAAWAGASPEVIAHDFTHFRLMISVHEALLSASAQVADANQSWYAPAAALSLGLPQPVRRIIAQSMHAQKLVPSQF